METQDHDDTPGTEQRDMHDMLSHCADIAHNRGLYNRFLQLFFEYKSELWTQLDIHYPEMRNPDALEKIAAKILLSLRYFIHDSTDREGWIMTLYSGVVHELQKALCRDSKLYDEITFKPIGDTVPVLLAPFAGDFYADMEKLIGPAGLARRRSPRTPSTGSAVTNTIRRCYASMGKLFPAPEPGGVGFHAYPDYPPKQQALRNLLRRMYAMPPASEGGTEANPS